MKQHKRHNIKQHKTTQ